MEFMMLMAIAYSVFLVWKKPEKEGLAFGCFLFSLFFCVMLYMFAVTGNFLPESNF